MAVIRKIVSSSLFPLLALCISAQLSRASLPQYHQNVVVGQDGKSVVQITNDAVIPIFAYVLAEYPSLGPERRSYFDFYTGEIGVPIRPGASITQELPDFNGPEGEVRAEVLAVVFQDGSSDGDPIWANAVLARRLRFYDRALSLYKLLSPLVGTAAPRGAIVDKLRAAETGALSQLPHDDLYFVDSMAFSKAISAIDRDRQVPADVLLKRYVASLELRAAQLERSRPALDTIRSSQMAVPEHQSRSSVPTELRLRGASVDADGLAGSSPHPSIGSTKSARGGRNEKPL